MKPFQIYAVLLAGLFLGFAYSTAQANAVSQQVSVQPILLQENFRGSNLLPNGWRLLDQYLGQVSIQNRTLVLDGRANAYQPTTVLLPIDLEAKNNYRIDVELSVSQPMNASRWAGLIYQVQPSSAKHIYPYAQFTLRSATAASNGTEFGMKQANGRWQVFESKAFHENLKANQTYTASVIISGQRIQHYLNGVLMQDGILPVAQNNGRIGLSAAGLLLQVKQVKVSQLAQPLAALPAPLITVPSIKTGAALAPSLIQMGTQGQEFAQQERYTIDAELKLYDAEHKRVKTLAQYLSQPKRQRLLVLKIKDLATLNALVKFNRNQNLADITLMAEHLSLLQQVGQRLPQTRRLWDLSTQSQTQITEQELATLAQQANQHAVRILLLPAQWVNKSNVSFLQRFMLDVWAQSPDKNSTLASVLSSGVNGVLTSNSKQVASFLQQLPQPTLLRQPLLIGHRGVPTLEDENTLESAERAWQLGANIVEIDVNLSQDGHVVVMHDRSVNRTTNGQGDVEQLSLVQLQQLRTKQKNYPIPTLADYLQRIQQYPHVMLMIEMKSQKPELVQAIAQEIQRHQAQDQAMLTAFSLKQLQQAQQHLPTLSRGILVNQMPNNQQMQQNVQKLVQDSQTYMASYHPAYRQDLLQLMQQSKHRAVKFLPWSIADAQLPSLYVAGVHALSTDAIQLYSDYIVALHTAKTLHVKVDQAVVIPTQIRRQDGKTHSVQLDQLMVLENSVPYEIRDGKVHFLGKGESQVLVKYQHQINAQQVYYLLSEPVQIVIK